MAFRVLILKVGQGHTERVGGVRQWGLVEPESRPDHERDLLFVGGPAPDHGLFHPFRRVFKDRQTGQGGGENGGSARRPEGDGRAVGLHVDDGFDGTSAGLVAADHIRDALVVAGQAFRLAQAGVVLDDPIFKDLEGVAIAGHHTVAGAAQSRVDAEDDFHTGVCPNPPDCQVGTREILDTWGGFAYQFGMPPRRQVSFLTLSLGLSRAVLHTRALRRKLLFSLTLGLLGAVAVGWILLGGMESHPLVFLVYWCGVGFFTLGVFLLALYDLLAVRRELKSEKNGR